jgi:hypothetical protein
LEKQSDPVVKFLLSGSKQVATLELSDVEEKISNCTKGDKCYDFVPVKIEQQIFDKQSEVFKIEAKEDFIMIQNEIFSPIWSGEICSEYGCETLPSFAVLDSLRSWELPKGEYIFKTQAQTPLNTQRWILFFFGVLFALLSVKINKSNKV